MTSGDWQGYAIPGPGAEPVKPIAGLGFEVARLTMYLCIIVHKISHTGRRSKKMLIVVNDTLLVSDLKPQLLSRLVKLTTIQKATIQKVLADAGSSPLSKKGLCEQIFFEMSDQREPNLLLNIVYSRRNGPVPPGITPGEQVIRVINDLRKRFLGGSNLPVEDRRHERPRGFDTFTNLKKSDQYVAGKSKLANWTVGEAPARFQNYGYRAANPANQFASPHNSDDDVPPPPPVPPGVEMLSNDAPSYFSTASFKRKTLPRPAVPAPPPPGAADTSLHKSPPDVMLETVGGTAVDLMNEPTKRSTLHSDAGYPPRQSPEELWELEVLKERARLEGLKAKIEADEVRKEQVKRDEEKRAMDRASRIILDEETAKLREEMQQLKRQEIEAKVTLEQGEETRRHLQKLADLRNDGALDTLEMRLAAHDDAAEALLAREKALRDRQRRIEEIEARQAGLESFAKRAKRPLAVARAAAAAGSDSDADDLPSSDEGESSRRPRARPQTQRSTRSSASPPHARSWQQPAGTPPTSPGYAAWVRRCNGVQDPPTYPASPSPPPRSPVRNTLGNAVHSNVWTEKSAGRGPLTAARVLSSEAPEASVSNESDTLRKSQRPHPLVRLTSHLRSDAALDQKDTRGPQQRHERLPTSSTVANNASPRGSLLTASHNEAGDPHPSEDGAIEVTQLRHPSHGAYDPDLASKEAYWQDFVGEWGRMQQRFGTEDVHDPQAVTQLRNSVEANRATAVLQA